MKTSWVEYAAMAVASVIWMRYAEKRKMPLVLVVGGSFCGGLVWGLGDILYHTLSP